ncbi:hypothetical protein EX30DRAFT_344689 [Ascodesmis nigricans]|uniref:Uncharacterized protein n=1 Tax=Ascodesmis nigricans TaxID=341454 RepID=A0A4S2MIN7_9PEZI|nr:hypothetical protein EX30DRAFT_344689 [Ascodesmis nigricans]
MRRHHSSRHTPSSSRRPKPNPPVTRARNHRPSAFTCLRQELAKLYYPTSPWKWSFRRFVKRLLFRSKKRRKERERRKRDEDREDMDWLRFGIWGDGEQEEEKDERSDKKKERRKKKEGGMKKKSGRKLQDEEEYDDYGRSVKIF